MSSTIDDENVMPEVGDSAPENLPSGEIETGQAENDVETGTNESQSITQKAPEPPPPPPPPTEPPPKDDSDDENNNDIEEGKKRQSISSKSNPITESLIVPGAISSSSARNLLPEIDQILVLVNLDVLNSTASSTSSSNNNLATTTKVNKFGFPSGYGRNGQERSGPYLFVACAYKNVRRLSHSLKQAAGNKNIVTVERCDTGELVTINPKWETYVLEDRAAVLAAVAAAKMNSEHKETFLWLTKHLAHNEPASEHADQDFQRQDGWNGMLQLIDTKVVPLWNRIRLRTKALGTQLVQGARPFSCKVRITGINLLVVCSTLFLFLQVFQLGWASPRFDDDLSRLELAIWCILVVELIFEVLIRPKNYKELMHSEKAYRPSTARHINKMFVFGETLALLLYIPEIVCFNKESDETCLAKGPAGRLLLVNASAAAVLGPTPLESLVGRLVLGSMAFRFFAVVRHWQHMLIQQTFRPVPREGLEKWIIPFDPASRLRKPKRKKEDKHQNDEDSDSDGDDDETVDIDTDETEIDFSETKESRRLKSAANIGTALIVVNCQRALILMVLSVLVVPLFYTVTYQNLASVNLTKLLQAENLASTTGLYDCDYLEQAVDSWLNLAIVDQLEDHKGDINETPYVLWARVLPVRCPFQDKKGVITSCKGKQSRFRKCKDCAKYAPTCDEWDSADPVPDVGYGSTTDIREYFAGKLNLRVDGIFVNQQPTRQDSFAFNAMDPFQVTVVFNQNPTIEQTNIKEFILLVVVFLLGLAFLVVLRNDVYSLALNPIQRMLKIVIRYAENPLSADVQRNKTMVTRNSTALRTGIGDIETEQLLSAITKISDLLRKCWGVAGAGIISSNLGRQKDGQVAVFNPTVPGKQVYALFGFVAICGYSRLLKALDGDVMILINDIASVVHEEVYRWALGEHGQCNKNLGPAFLMVWRIGDFNEVQQKNKVAIEKLFRDKVYKTKNRNHPNLRRRNIKSPYSKNNTMYSTSTARSTVSTLSTGYQEVQLENLPGIRGFADRALLGMLKSFASLHRDRYLQDWKNDPRLRNTHSSYSVDVIYGMDAGWAVEGAVGSEYKIDATYLSPHVNMASRMMSASKQYGATILLSKSVEKLLSKPCRTKLRHLDTVYVKGSAIKQAIYTYDARSAGVDFFLLERTPEQADRESEAYTPAIWDQDPDLLAMRRHATDEFMETYHNALKLYLEGSWKEAHEFFEKADDIMIETVLDEGYIEIADDDLLDVLEKRILDKSDMGEDVVQLRQQFGDGACRTLMNYIERRNFEAPEDWKGVRKLFSK